LRFIMLYFVTASDYRLLGASSCYKHLVSYKITHSH
jgi:hypothetical protein